MIHFLQDIFIMSFDRGLDVSRMFPNGYHVKPFANRMRAHWGSVSDSHKAGRKTEKTLIRRQHGQSLHIRHHCQDARRVPCIARTSGKKASNFPSPEVVECFGALFTILICISLPVSVAEVGGMQLLTQPQLRLLLYHVNWLYRAGR